MRGIMHSIAIVFLIVRQVQCSINDLMPTSRSSNLAQATTRIILDEHSNVPNTVHIIKWRTTKGGIIEEIITAISPFVAYSIEDEQHIRRWYPRHYNVFIIHDLPDVDRISGIVNSINFDPYGNYIVVVKSKGIPLETITNIFTIFFNSYFVNVNVLMRDLNGAAFLYTFFPCSPTHTCYEIVPVLYNSFDGKQYREEVAHFPKKFQNFHGCPVTAVLFPIPPYVFLNSTGNDTWTIDGIDGRLLLMIADGLNFTLKIINSWSRGRIQGNGYANGGLGLLSTGPGNLTMGGIENHPVQLKFLSPSINYLHTETVFVLPIPDEYTSAERLVHPFTSGVWICLFCTFIQAALAVGILKKCPAKYRRCLVGGKTGAPLLKMYQIMLGIPARKSPRGLFVRSLFASWLLVNIVLNSTYRGKLIEFMSSSMHKQGPQTIENLLNLNYEFYFPLHMMQGIHQMYPNYSRSRFHGIVNSNEEYLSTLQISKKRQAALQTQLSIDYFNARHYSNGVLPILSERFRSIPLSILFKKNSYFVQPFESIIGDISQSGLMEKIVNEIINQRVFDSKYHEPKRLTVSHYEGCLKICGLMLVCACLIVGVELLSVRCERLRRIVLFWTEN